MNKNALTKGWKYKDWKDKGSRNALRKVPQIELRA